MLICVREQSADCGVCVRVGKLGEVASVNNKRRVQARISPTGALSDLITSSDVN
jgi:hypothetical protein